MTCFCTGGNRQWRDRARRASRVPRGIPRAPRPNGPEGSPSGPASAHAAGRRSASGRPTGRRRPRRSRQRHRSPFALGPGLRRVREDAEDPGAQRGTALERANAVNHADPRLLDDLVGDRRAAHIPERQPAERCVVVAHELPESLLVTAAQRRQQSCSLSSGGSLHTTSTRMSSRPSERTRSSRPKSCDWSTMSPTRAVAPSHGSTVIPVKPDAKRSDILPRTTIR